MRQPSDRASGRSPRSLFRRARTRFRGAGRAERAAWVAGIAVSSPVTVPLFLGLWAQDRAQRRYFVATRRPAEVPPDPSVEAQIAALPDTFALVRVIGNDLPPRHKIGQSRENLDFVLRNEPPFEACEKLWIVNRIVDKAEEARIVARLEEAGATYEVIPFEADEYAQVPLDFSRFTTPQILLSEAFADLDEPTQARVVAQIHRLKNAYVMHNNGARNRSISLGQARAKWVLPFDGNCFVTQADWDRIRADVTGAPDRQYFIVPMARLGSNDRAFDAIPPEEAQEEPQILFRRDAPERFDEAHPYGRRPKVELLARLGVSGPWKRWLMDPWDIPGGAVSASAHRVSRAGMVRRLASGRADLEAQASTAMQMRATVRADAVVATLRRADAMVLAARGYAPDRPVLFDRAHLSASAQDPLGSAVAEARSSATADKDLSPAVSRRSESDMFDRSRWQMVSDDTITCALAWAIHGDTAARDHARRLVRTWFVDLETAMAPHLRVDQLRRGQGSTGILEFKDIAFLLDAVRLLDDPALSDELRGWLRDHADWLVTSEQGVKERRAKNKRGTCFDLQLAAISAFLGDTDRLLDSWMHSVSRIGGQFDDRGAQPHEPSHHGSAFNLQSWLTLLAIYRGCGLPVEAQSELARIRAGVTWFLNHRGTEWPYQQTAGFDPDRFAPIALAAAHLGLGPAPAPEDVALLAARPRFDPHDGIPPYWSLMSGLVGNTKGVAP